MLSARGKNGFIIAWDAKQNDGPFTCPGCRQEVILKKGYVNVHHFAHKPGVECPYSDYHQGESPQHLGTKKAIYETLKNHPDVARLQLERYLGPVRPDISFYLGDTPVAIEMQISAITPDVMSRRTREYTRRGIALLWIFPFDKQEVRDGRGCSIRSWERYIHSLYQGTVYYWLSGELLQPIHFEDYINEESTHLISSGMQIATFHKPIAITDLEATYFCSRFADALALQAVKFWCKPQIWIQQDRDYLDVVEAQNRYPFTYPDPSMMIRPAGEALFSGDPFSEDGYPETIEEIAPAGRCPRHNKLYLYTDAFGECYCSDVECWARLRLSRAGTEHGYPQLSGIIDSRDYLPDLTAEPYYLPALVKGMAPIPVYPAKPPVRAVLIEEGKGNWHEYVAHQPYTKIDQALFVFAHNQQCSPPNLSK